MQWLVIPPIELVWSAALWDKGVIMHDMMSGGMMWGMGLFGLLLLVLLVLTIAALVKYLFFGRRS